ncbi:hypothetical protein MMB232_01162 [Brevundimonas subvibrioides]|uniref:protoporphyrinogen/coproporphyrinogen oxidase n=1 Tax=Brevundimonas subvibrioides TaxID=74313 RepID=UPI0032D5954C
MAGMDQRVAASYDSSFYPFAEEVDGHYDVLVIGAGISGLVAARQLQQAGKRVVILERAEDAGGLQRSRTIGGFTFDLGSFILGAGDPFFRLFPTAVAGCVPISASVQKLSPHGNVCRYPFDAREDLLRHSIVYQIAAVASLLLDKLRFAKAGDTEQFIRAHTGGWLFRRTGLEQYVERMFGCPSHVLSLSFARRRLSWIQNAGSLRRRLKTFRVAPPASAHPVARPREGFERMFDSAIEELMASGVRIEFGVDISGLSDEAGVKRAQVHGRGSITADTVISTAPPSATLRMLGDDTHVALEYVSLLTLYFTASADRLFDSAILYNFSDDPSWKRLTVHSDYYGVVGERAYFSVEVPYRGAAPTLDEAASRVTRHLEKRGLFTDMKLIGHDHTAFAYPIHDGAAEARLADAHGRLAAFGIHTLGRQGQFDYLATGRATAQNAIGFVDDLLVPARPAP